MRILKWTLRVTDRQEVSLPAGALILDVQCQGEEMRLWALCDDDAARGIEDRVIRVYGTGSQIPSEPGMHIATVQMCGGKLVWHVFEDTTPTR